MEGEHGGIRTWWDHDKVGPELGGTRTDWNQDRMGSGLGGTGKDQGKLG